MTLSEMQKFNQASYLSLLTYQEEKPASNSKFIQIDKSNHAFGFRGALYKNTETGKYTVVFCGTNDAMDAFNDIQMATNNLPLQYSVAENYINNIK